VTNVFALAIMPMEVEKVTVTNLVEHQNFGDLVGTLSFGGQHAILNNHDGFGNTYGTRPIVYDDSQDHPLGTTNTDGPGSLLNFRGQSALGPWILSELANSAGGFTGQVSRLTLLIQPHRDLKQPGIIVSVPPGGWFIDYVDVSPGYTNLTFYGTNVTVSPGTPPLQMYERLNLEPTQNNFDQEATLTNGTPPGNSISLGPPLSEGRYFVGIYNPDGVSQNVYLSASLGVNASVSDVFNFDSGSTLTLPDDAVTGSVIRVPDLVTQLISSVNVGLVVKSPRISDYTFTLVSPTGQRVLLMENRGAGDTNGAGSTFVFTNILNAIASGGPTANTNYLAVDPNGTSFPLTWNFYTQPDQMTIYDSTNPADFNPNGPYLIYNTGLTNNPTDIFGNNIPVNVNIQYPLGTTAITIIMNQLGNPDTNGSDLWTYNAGAAITNYEYLEFTDNTNLANVPIKFAAPPFNFTESFSNVVFSDLNRAVATNYYGPTNIADGFGTGWSLPTNLLTYSTIVTNAQFATISNLVSLTNNFVTVETDPSTALGGSNVLALARGTITRLIPTTPGRLYNVTFWYRGPGIAGWWRGEGNALDSSDPENLHNNGTLIGRFNFPAGEVDQAFGFGDPGNTYQFAGTNTYVQVPASRSLDVGAGGGFTVEGWINPTNVSRPAPLVEWLAKVPTNAAVADTNLAIVQGPVFNPATGHYYYLLSPTNWITSANWAAEMGGTLATLETANENQWIYDTFTAYGTLNRDLWIGLNDYGFPGAFNWKGSTSRVTFTDWTPGEPAAACSSDDFVAIMGPTNAYPGLWSLAGNNREICGHAPALPIYGVVEVPQLQPNGVQFWVSGTNGTPAGANPLSGSLYANIVDVNDVSHPIVSAPGLLVSNVYQHVALTYNTNSGIAALYLNGTNVAYTNIGVFVPKTSGDLLIGQDMSAYTNNYFGGEMDEMSLYSRSLSLAEISAIYHASADTSNRLVGKFDAAVTPAVGLAEALVAFGPATNVIFGFNNQWTENSYTFTATSNSMPLTISGLEPGILLDSFSVAEAPETNLYYLPEQDLSALAGSSAAGNWSLQIWDNRVGAYVTNANQLVDWQLSFVLASNAVVAGSLQPLTPLTGTVPGGQTVYYAVPVPLWAHAATNILLSSSLPVDLLYYGPANPPTGGNAADANWLTGSTGGIGQVLVTNGTPPLLPGQTYYLAVRNNNAHAATVSLEVDFDIYGLSNNVPVTGDLTNEYQAVRYFSYDVGSNAYEATFQLLELSGNADLVVRKGIPLPGLQSADYGSFSPSNADESIYVLTNSTPVVLSPGRWYIGVYNRDNTLTHYSVLAKELDITGGVTNFTVIDLTNGVPFTWTAGPGAALTNFFRFHATDPIVGGNTEYLQGLRFEVYDLSGNGDLTVATNIPPLAPPFFQTSQNPGTDPELVFVYTNSALPDLAGDWYLGVPNREVTNISYTIIAEVLTNAYFPAFPGAEGAGGGALGGRFGDVYHVTSLADSGPSTLRDAVTSAAGPRTVVFDASGTISLQTPLIITASDLTIAGETAPGGGITVAGQMTSISGAHDVVIRDVRFRRGAADDSLQLLNVSNSIADHISAEWTSDNLVSILNSSNVTVQWSLMGDSLYSLTNWDSSNPPTGSLLRQGAGSLSFHHNLYADNYTGSPRLGDNLTLDFVNNVIYNWGAHSGLTGTNDTDLSPGGYTNRLNYVANYLIAGPDTALLAPGNFNMTNIAFLGTFTNASAATWIFQTNNFIDSDINGQLNGSDTGWGMFTNDYTRFGRGFPTVPVGVDEAYLAYEKVLDFAGTESATRDSIDTNIIARVRNQTGRLISSPPYTGIIAWWKAEGNAIDSVGANNGILTGGLGFAPGEVGQEFHFSNTNDYVFVPAAPALNVGADSGFTIEEWIRPSNVLAQMPLFGWGTNASLQSVNTNVILGPILNTNNGHFYYLLQTNTWSNSESIAVQLGGHLATVRNVSEQLWISNTFSMYAGVPRNLWIGLYDPSHDSGVGAHAQNFVWISGDPSNFRPWASGEPNDCGGDEFWGMVFAPYPAYLSGTAGLWNDLVDSGANCGAPGFLALNGVVEATNPPVGAPYFWISVGAPGSLYANLLDATNGSHVISTGSLLQSNVYQHVAWTYNTNSGVSTLYLNGSVVASANVGPIVLNTTGDVYLGKRIDGAPSDIYSGGMDEVTLYKRALSAGEISAIYEAGKAGKFMSQYASGGFVLPYLDTDQDGLPDFWEYTFTPNQVFMPSNNQDRNGDGYTDLEEYDNWLAAPHALTVTNTATGVDLYQMFGESGNLAFYVTNAVHGQVYLTNVLATVTNTSPVWSNTIAYFTPQANYSGYASFDCYVTNLDTAAYFGPVTVSVIVSAVQVVTNYNFPPNPTPLFSGVPVDPINTNGTDYYYIDVTTNDYGAVFEIDDPQGPLAIVVNQGLRLPSLSYFDYATNMPPAPANQQIFVLTNSSPVPLSPGRWNMGVVNEAGSNVEYTVNITLLQHIYAPEFLYPTNGALFTNIETTPFTLTCLGLDTNTPPLPLSFSIVSGPSNLTITTAGVIHWTSSESQGGTTNLVAVSVSNGGFSVTNTFSIVVEISNQPPVLPVIPNQLVLMPGGQLLVTNSAYNPNLPNFPLLGYTLRSTVTGANVPVIDTNGVITWTPLDLQSGSNYLLTTVVTDSVPGAINANSLSATNSFYVTVLPELGSGGPVGFTNLIPGEFYWFAVPVPTNALYATNTLVYSTLPINLWFTTNLPPTITNAADRVLLWDATNGVSILSTSRSTAPTNIVPGGYYLLGVQNTNATDVSGELDVSFALAPPPYLSLPFIPDQYVIAGDTLVVADTATDENPAAPLTYRLVNPPAGATINGSGIITWHTTVPMTVTITAVVTDAGAGLSATNSFAVVVLPGLGTGGPGSGTVSGYSTNWYIVRVPPNADMATNSLISATAPLNLEFSTNRPPSIGGLGDSELLTNVTSGFHVITTSSAPALVAGSRYFLGLENTNSFAVNYQLNVTFHFTALPIFSIVQTNRAGTNGFLITWYAPTNYQFHLQWTPQLAPATWMNFNGVISDVTVAPGNGQFQYFDDGSQTGGFGPTRFYRLLLLNSPTNTAPFFLNTPMQFPATPLVPFLYTNSAADWDLPLQILTYFVTNTLAGTNVTINSGTGVIAWTPDPALAGLTNIITTVVFDNGVPLKSATNSFAVVVGTNLAPVFSSIAVVSGGVKFQWSAPTNEEFQIRWTTNLAPDNWHLFPNTNVSTTGGFSFVDTNTPLLMKFYQLILLP
jgi:subtilisin-like proprotein convertase family protein